MTQRAKLWMGSVAAAMVTAGCLAPAAPRPHPLYDIRTRQLLRLDWDADGDGRIDQRTYFVNARAVRTEWDGNGDGQIERWEYVGEQAAVTHVGTSSVDDGIEDTWTWPPDGSGEIRVERAQGRDGVVDRREFLRNETLVRVEEDANRDGKADKWETWDNGALTTVAFDTRQTSGRPDRRIVYRAGQFAYLETDPDGDGTFARRALQQPGSGDRHP